MMRLRRRDAGISMILVVVLILLTLVLVVAAIILMADFRQKERLQAALKNALDNPQTGLTAQESTILSAMVKANEATGFKMPEDGRSMPDTPALELMKKKKTEYWDSTNFDKYPITPNLDGQRKPMSADQIKRFNEAREDSKLFATLQELVKLAAARTLHIKNRADQLEVELMIAKEQTKNREAVRPEIPKRKIEKKAELLKDIADVSQMIGKENEDYNTRKTQHTEAKAKADMEKAEEEAKFVEFDVKMLNETRELRRQLEELKVKEVIKHEISYVHGKILRPDIPNRTAFINIGSRERVVPGLKFLIGKRGEKFGWDFKGKIEVKKVWMTYSEVAIIEIADPQFRPIIEGDTIVNPLFSKNGPVVMAFVGETQAVRVRYSVDEAARRIREIGSEVRKDVSLDVDYVIFTEAKGSASRESYEAYQKARFLEIPIAEAADMYRFLGD